MPLNIIPVILTSYLFIYGAASFWFTFPVFWGLSFLFIGLWGVFKSSEDKKESNPLSSKGLGAKKYRIITVIGFLMAILTHWLFIISWFAASLVAIIRKDRMKNLYIFLPGIISAIPLILHYRHILSIKQTTSAAIIQNMSKGDAIHSWVTLMFSSVLISQLPVLLVLISLLLLTTLLFLKKDFAVQIMFSMGILPPVLFFKLGPETYRDYWGIIYLPFILIVSCYFLPVLEEKILKRR
jgi:hypothetical protein